MRILSVLLVLPAVSAAASLPQSTLALRLPQTTLPVSAAAPSYASLHDEAVRRSCPLVLGLACDPPASPRWLSGRVEQLAGFQPGQVLVAVPDGQGCLDCRATLTGPVTAAQVLPYLDGPRTPPPPLAQDVQGFFPAFAPRGAGRWSGRGFGVSRGGGGSC